MEKVNTIIKMINRKNTKEMYETIIDMFYFDEDLNGNNGKDFTSKEAIDNSFDSDLDYYYNYISTKKMNLKQSLDFILEKAFLHNNYYDEIAYDIDELKNDVSIVSLSYII